MPSRPKVRTLAVLVAAGGSWQLYEVGHSGAKAVWNDVTEEAG